jgi:hypothetical protein
MLIPRRVVKLLAYRGGVSSRLPCSGERGGGGGGGGPDGRGAAAGTGAERRRGAAEAVRPRTAARKEREAAPRIAMVQ